MTEPAAAAGERGRGSGPSRAAGGAAAVGEAARKPHRGAGAAETCCYICWVKHGLCCDLKRVLKTHSSVAFLKEMKASHSFWCTGLMKWLKECRIFFFRKCPQSLLIARGGIFNWTSGNTGEANPLIIIHIFPQMNLNQTWRGREMSGTSTRGGNDVIKSLATILKQQRSLMSSSWINIAQQTRVKSK